jgi:hypothetical protein
VTVIETIEYRIPADELKKFLGIRAEDEIRDVKVYFRGGPGDREVRVVKVEVSRPVWWRERQEK